ncbi:CHAP domain-containing protein [Terrabacter sp. NPDC080008]|uniref:CHAP domain-containing protein n=1 Tax=Terrabacter sp. NPDC080008 TaxID=3155176 RepID=UPI00344DDF87
MPLATFPRVGSALAARSTRVRRRLALLVTALAVLVSTVGLAGPARSYEWTVLCHGTSYTACTNAGYTDGGYAAKASSSWWSQSTGHNCTNYVAYRLVQNGMPNVRPAGLSGNAYNWGLAFANKMDDAPAVGSVAWFGQSFSSTGHVAYVEKVISPDQIQISEDNWGGEFRWRTVSRSGGYWPAGFIHFKDVGPKVAQPADYPTYKPVAPTRIVDTRSGLGASGPLAAGSDTSILVTGKAGLPKTALGAVVVNVTAVNASKAGWLLAYPSGTSPAASSTVNFGRGDTLANQAVVGVGQDGRIRVRVSQATHVLVDVVGWYPSFGNLRTTTPTRLLDTRSGLGTTGGRLPSGGRVDLQVTGTSVVPSSGVDSVLINLTAASPSGPGWLAAWPAGASRPNSSSLNYDAGTALSGLVVAKVGAGGKVSIMASSSTDVVADVVGWYPSPADYLGLTPSRLLDTRDGTGVGSRGAVDPSSVIRLKVTGRGGVPATGVKAVVLTLTVTAPESNGFLTAYPSYTARPTTSNLNYLAGQTIANTAFVRPSSDGYVDIYAQQGTQVVADVQGYLAQ